MHEVQEMVERLNRAWQTGQFAELDEVLDPEVVLVPPGSGTRVLGREAVVQSYREFTTQAVVHRFDPDPPEIDEFGGTAVANCPYTIEYEIGGRRWRGSGRDLLVCHRGEGGWRVVWRTMLPGPEEEVPGEGAGPQVAGRTDDELI